MSLFGLIGFVFAVCSLCFAARELKLNRKLKQHVAEGNALLERMRRERAGVDAQQNEEQFEAFRTKWNAEWEEWKSRRPQ